MQDILQQILADKRIEVEAAKRALPYELLDRKVEALPARRRLSMRAALEASQSGIIAEFKRKSPSKGWIHPDALPTEVVPGYAAAGASALSVLTDSKYFGGCLDFIRRVRPLVDIPILRKDFIIDEYQLLEAREAGADAVLVIAAAMPVERAAELVAEAHRLGLEVLLEIHSADELPYVEAMPDMEGVNNRNLGSFHTDVENSFRIAGMLPEGVTRVSESGISNPVTVCRLRDEGFRGFLIGESLMREADPAAALAEFVNSVTRKS